MHGKGTEIFKGQTAVVGYIEMFADPFKKWISLLFLLKLFKKVKTIVL